MLISCCFLAPLKAYFDKLDQEFLTSRFVRLIGILLSQGKCCFVTETMIKIEITSWRIKSRVFGMDMLFRDKTMIKIEIMSWRVKSRVFGKLICFGHIRVFLSWWKCRFVEKMIKIEVKLSPVKSRVFGKLIRLVTSLYFHLNGSAVSWKEQRPA